MKRPVLSILAIVFIAGPIAFFSCGIIQVLMGLNHPIIALTSLIGAFLVVALLVTLVSRSTPAAPQLPQTTQFAPDRQHLIGLFRYEFLRLTSDGIYTPERQQQLWQFSQNHGLEWDVARRAVAPEAQALLERQARALAATGSLNTPDGRQQLDRLQRRLALTDVETTAVLARAAQASLQGLPGAPQVAPIFNPADFKRAIQRLSPNGFEAEIKRILEYLGWQDVVIAGGRGDRGVDLTGRCNGQRCIVQCKHHPGRNITPAMVRELVGALHIQRSDRAILITSGDFTSRCYAETTGHPVELWNLDALIHRITDAQRQGSPFILPGQHQVQRPPSA